MQKLRKDLLLDVSETSSNKSFLNFKHIIRTDILLITRIFRTPQRRGKMRATSKIKSFILYMEYLTVVLGRWRAIFKPTTERWEERVQRARSASSRVKGEKAQNQTTSLETAFFFSENSATMRIVSPQLDRFGSIGRRVLNFPEPSAPRFFFSFSLVKSDASATRGKAVNYQREALMAGKWSTCITCSMSVGRENLKLR